MKNRHLVAVLILSMAVATLISCGSSSQSSLPEVTIDEGEMSYLKGRFYGKDGVLTLDKDALKIDDGEVFSLKPTSVGTVKTTYGDDEETEETEVPGVYFASEYNNGKEYRFYADIEGDGFLHLDEKVGDSYVNIGEYQPDISAYAAPFSYYGDGSATNYYYIIDPSFDHERNVYPMSACYGTYWSDEQAWYVIARLRTKANGTPYFTAEQFDSDDYGWGEYELKTNENGAIEWYDNKNAYAEFASDPGVFYTQNLFDGEKSVSLTCDPSEKTIKFGDLSGTYTSVVDGEGLHLNAVFGEDSMNIWAGNRHIKTRNKATGVEKVYPIDDVTPLVGTFTDKKDTASFSLDRNNVGKLAWNGGDISFSYVTANDRKAISFSADGNSYVMAPDKENSSVYLSKNGVDGYFINDELYSSLFVDSFLAHDAKNDFALVIDGDFSYSLLSEKGEATYSYWHGDKYPSLLLGEKGKRLSIAQASAGYYLLSEPSKEDVNLYSETKLNQIYGEYSGNGRDSFVISASSISYEGMKYEYSFAPYFYQGYGTYFFGISSSFGDFISDRDGVIYSTEHSFVKKDRFLKAAGKYALYGKYGFETIEFTEDGHLYIDTYNEATKTLDHTEYEYVISTSGSGDIVTIGIPYGEYTVLLYIYDGYAKFSAFVYYSEDTVLSWGSYVDSGLENALFIQDGSIYLNGDELTVNAKTNAENTIIYDTDKGMLTIKKAENSSDYSALLSTGEGTIEFTKAIDYPDYSKFCGTYTAKSDSSKTVTFRKTNSLLTTYEAVLDGKTTVPFSDITSAIYDGKLALLIPNFLEKYYLTIDLTSGEIACEYDAGSVPPPPPIS